MDLLMMTEQESLPKNKHKEETRGRIKSGAMDHESLCHTLSECINPMDPGSHPAGALINIAMVSYLTQVSTSKIQSLLVRSNFKQLWVFIAWRFFTFLSSSRL